MKRDSIARVSRDADGRLHVVPLSAELPLVYREAMEVHWNPERHSLYSPAPREWSYGDWFLRILDAALAQDVALELTPDTLWENLEPEEVERIVQAFISRDS